MNALVVCAWMVALPTAVFAQSSITGVVKDSSGAVLPGVTVEAASDSLIEKVRTAVSDGSGQYRIVDLRAGVYTVTFTLAGFNTFKREALELPTDFVATVNADMRVGSLQETITVTGEARSWTCRAPSASERSTASSYRRSRVRVRTTASSV